MREVRAALRYNKPILAVHEEAVDKGGAPLDELKAECPDEAFEAIFGQVPIPWLRAKPMHLFFANT